MKAFRHGAPPSVDTELKAPSGVLPERTNHATIGRITANASTLFRQHDIGPRRSSSSADPSLMPEVSVRTFLPVAIATGTATFVGRLFFGQQPAFVVPL